MTVAPLILGFAEVGEGRLFVNLLVILATASVVATLFKRARLETIPGYLVAGAIAGAVAGPGGIGIIRDLDEVEPISGLAIILLMFTIGLMLDTGSMRRGMLPILGVGLATTALNTALGWPIVIAFGQHAAPALVIAMAMSMSSTAVLVRILQQRREFRQTHGRVCLGIAIVQDIVSVLLLAMIPPIAVWASRAGSAPAAEETGLSGVVDLVSKGALYFGGIIVMLAAGRVLLPRLVGAVARSEARGGGSELVLVLSAAIAMGSALATAALKFSPEMGAFLAGLMLSFTPFRHQLAGQLAPMKDLLMAVFFTAIGLKISPQVLGAHWMEIGAGLVILVALKTFVLGGTAWAFGASGSVAVLTGVYLGQAGEFTLVILGVADRAGVFGAGGVGVPIAIVVLSLIISPMLIDPAHALAARLSGLRPAPWLRQPILAQTPPGAESEDAPTGRGPEASEGRVLIAGFGPVGRHLADKFQRTGRPYTIIELNPVTVFKQHRLGRPIVFGDVTNPEVLETAGLRHADALILTIPDEDAIVRAIEVARRMAPHLFIAARTNYLSQAIQARQAGADHVTVEEVATAGLLEREVTEKLAARKKAREALDVEAQGEKG